jgi:hypothetical protein
MLNLLNWLGFFGLRPLHMGRLPPLIIVYTPHTYWYGSPVNGEYSIGCNQWFSLAKIALKVPPAGRSRSPVARTNKYGECIIVMCSWGRPPTQKGLCNRPQGEWARSLLGVKRPLNQHLWLSNSWHGLGWEQTPWRTHVTMSLNYVLKTS